MSQIEVLSGPERRRRWSAEQKLEIVRASFEPDVTIAEVARRFDVTRQQIYQWRSDCRAGRSLLAAGEMVRFAAVDVAPTPISSVGGDDGHASEPVEFAERVELVLAGGRCLRIPAGIDGARLQDLIRAIEAA